MAAMQQQAYLANSFTPSQKYVTFSSQLFVTYLLLFWFQIMPPPRDRMAAMQQQAYLEDDDTMMDMNDEHDPAMQEFFRQIEVLLYKKFEKKSKHNSK